MVIRGTSGRGAYVETRARGKIGRRGGTARPPPLERVRVANAKLYLHETIHIVGTGSEAYKRHTGMRRPSGAACLDAVARPCLRLATRRALALAGAWRPAMRDTEAVLLWCLPTLRDFTRHLADLRTAPETRAWHAQARAWRTDYRETLLVASV